MKGRMTGAVALLAVAVLGLTGCDTKVGQAAVVGNYHLTDSQLGEYVTDKAAPYTDTSSGDTIVPKSLALGIWVFSKVATEAIHAHGGVIKQSELDQARSALLGDTPLSTIEKQYTPRGFTTKFGDALVDRTALLVVLEKRLNPQATITQIVQDLSSGQGQLLGGAISELQKYSKGVNVSGRYGSWDRKNLTVDGSDGAGLPDFVSFGSSTPAPAAQ